MLTCCYRSPTPSESSNQNNERRNRLFRCIEIKNYSHRCIVGDFNFKNINLSTWTTPCNENSTETSFIEAVRDSYLYQHVEETTPGVGTMIHPCLTLYSLMKQCKSQIFNTTPHWARVTTVLFHLNFIAISILLKLKRVIHMRKVITFQ